MQIKVYVKDMEDKTISGVQVDIYDDSNTAIDSFMSSNRFKSIDLPKGEYAFVISSAETVVDDIMFKISVDSALRITETHPNVALTDDKLTVHVSEQVLTMIAPEDDTILSSEEPPMPEQIDDNNGPNNDRHSIEQHVLNMSVQIPARKPLPIYISPTKNAKQNLYVGGLRIVELSGTGWFTVKYINRGHGGRKTGYVKESDLKFYVK